MPNDPRNAKREHLEERITLDTQFFDIDQIALPGSTLPHTLPDLKTFSEAMRQLQIKNDDRVVCYDNVGIFSSARAAWMLRYFGATDVRVLNGGLKKWKAEKRIVNSGP